MKNKYACMGCGFCVFADVFATYEICPICNFQDDLAGVRYPFIDFFEESLLAMQTRILKEIPYDIKEYKKGKTIYYRNSLWKPIDKKRLDKNHDYFPKWKFDEFYDKYPNHSNFQRKIMEEAQKHNPDDDIHLEM